MCSILFSTKELDNFDYVNERLKLRGPDHTEVLSIDKPRKMNFVHNLLSITGKFTKIMLTNSTTSNMFTSPSPLMSEPSSSTVAGLNM